jgi:hypothetical protein
MQATMHWPKSDLVAVARMMRDAGYEGFGNGHWWGGSDTLPWNLSDWTKQQLVDAINASGEQTQIFGNASVSVVKEPAQFRWVVSTPPPQSRLLLRIDWTAAYEWKEFLVGNSRHRDLFAALECCLSVEPLDAQDRARLEAARPGITAKPMFLVDADAWETEDEPEDEPEPPPPPPPKRKLGASSKPPEWSKLSPKRKIRL